MKSDKKDIVIASLEYSRERFMKGETFDFSDLSNHLLRTGYFDPNDAGSKSDMIRALYDQIMTHHDYALKRWMSLDAYIGLVDYEELQLAREDSARARKEAREAINHAEQATRLTKQALFWTKVSVIAAVIVGVAQLILQVYSK